MAAGNLWLLSISCGQFVANTIEKLYITLVRIFLESGKEGPGHGASGLRGNACICTVIIGLVDKEKSDEK